MKWSEFHFYPCLWFWDNMFTPFYISCPVLPGTCDNVWSFNFYYISTILIIWTQLLVWHGVFNLVVILYPRDQKVESSLINCMGWISTNDSFDRYWRIDIFGKTAVQIIYYGCENKINLDIQTTGVDVALADWLARIAKKTREKLFASLWTVHAGVCMFWPTSNLSTLIQNPAFPTMNPLVLAVSNLVNTIIQIRLHGINKVPM